jgi:hypothetical protein
VTVNKTIKLLALAAAVLAVLSVPAVALANFGSHGNYAMDTEECAGCHRAHTAPSSITWVDTLDRTKSALLLTDTTTEELFCLTCHDSTGQGAYTNVVEGVYYGTDNGTHLGAMTSGAFGRHDTVNGVAGLYDGFGRLVTSSHVTNGGTWGAFGGGTFGSPSTATADANGNVLGSLGKGSTEILMQCGTCHDVHGSSNYRILRDVVYGVTVGGYSGTGPDPTPAPFVISKETGFPVSGFLLHTGYPGYVPNYTVAQYSVAPGNDPLKGMSGWCVGCHTTYMTLASRYDAGDGYGYGIDTSPTIRHRHPINTPLSNFAGPRPLNVATLPVGVPLAHELTDASGAGNQPDTTGDWVDCLTCHNSHGASTVMTGWANVADPANVMVKDTGLGGVPPTNDSALLRLDNRSACEMCHNM